MEYAKKEPREKINNAERLANFGGRIVHINGGQHFRSGTVAYKELGKNRLKVSFALCHRNDAFCKKIGTKTAIEHFEAGQTIVIPREKDIARNVRQVFGWFNA